MAKAARDFPKGAIPIGILRETRRYGVSPDALAGLWPRVAQALHLTVEEVDREDQLATLVAATPGADGGLAARYLVRFTPAFQAGVTVVTLTLNDAAALDGSEKLDVAGREFYAALERVLTDAKIDFSLPQAEVVLQEDRGKRTLLWLGGIFAVLVLATVLSFYGVFSGGKAPKLAPSNSVNAVTGLPTNPNAPKKEASMNNIEGKMPPLPADPSQAKGSVIKFETNKGDIIAELFDKDAPITAGSFLLLIEARFYNGLKFHRVVPDFVIQGGDPQGTGAGGPGFTIPDETKPYLMHDKGMLSMAKTAAPDTAGSQFFIVTGSAATVSHLNGIHSVYGRVLKGMDVVNKIAVGDVMKQVTVVKESPDAAAAKTAAKAARVPGNK